MQNLRKGMKLRGIFSAEAPDKSGEVVSIKGIDISAVDAGTAFVNSEHQQDFAKTVGKITKAKKIFEAKDCADIFEKRMFESVNRVPILVGEVELFDDEDHEEAKAIANIAKHFAKRKEPLNFGWSVEGAIVNREGPMINKSIMRKVAITASPCNAAAQAEVMSELSKSEREVYERISSNVKTENTISSNFGCEVVDEAPSQIADTINQLQVKVQKLQKALEAGMAMGGPSGSTQGAALQTQGVKPKIHKTGDQEESTTEGSKTEESGTRPKAKETEVEVSGLKEIDAKKIKVIDDKKEDINLKMKMKKAEFYAFSFFSQSLKK